MSRILIIILLIFTQFSFVFAQKSSRIPPEKPKLVIGIIVEQMRYDYLFKYMDKFGEGGFKRLLNEGATCKNANYNYLFTQTSVGHATIATGTNPSSHGIVAEEWYVPIKDNVVNCIEDENVSTVGGSYDAGKFSPRQLLTTTFGDEMRLASFMKSKVIGISMQAKAAMLATGQLCNAAYWLDDTKGIWVSSSFYKQAFPPWVTEFNDKKFADIYMAQTWETKFPMVDYLDRCLPDDETGIEGRKVFPYILSQIPITNKDSKKYSLLRYTPLGNSYTKDFAVSTIVNEELGKDDNTDLLMVTFSATEYIGKNFGPQSMELMDAFIRLDADLEHFFDFLDQELGKQNILVFLTSDHGVAHNPEFLADNGISVGYFSQTAAISLLKSYLNAIYGKGEWVKYYYAQQLYLNRDLIEDSKIKLADIQEKTAQFLLQFSGVANTITASTLQTIYFPSGVFSKMQNSYNQKRSGDVFINLEPGWIEKNGTAVEHNSAYSYDTHVPLIWYGWKIKRSPIFEAVDMIDIAPTVSYFLNIPYPNANTGRPIPGLVNQ
jgi:hypothetical protein